MSTPPSTVDPAAVERLRQNILSPWAMRFWMLKELPLAFAAGLRVTALDERHCTVTVPYGWRSQNPFRSTYFAAQSMAAEMSTGALGLLLVRAAPQPVSMLITGMQGEFLKKANRTIAFTCEEGAALQEAVLHTLRTGEPVARTVPSVGLLPDGGVAARFEFTWSFKRKG